MTLLVILKFMKALLFEFDCYCWNLIRFNPLNFDVEITIVWIAPCCVSFTTQSLTLLSLRVSSSAQLSICASARVEWAAWVWAPDGPSERKSGKPAYPLQSEYQWLSPPPRSAWGAPCTDIYSTICVAASDSASSRRWPWSAMGFSARFWTLEGNTVDPGFPHIAEPALPSSSSFGMLICSRQPLSHLNSGFSKN